MSEGNSGKKKNYQVYQVGGSVRDGLLGKTAKDRDFVVVGANADLLLAEGFFPVGKDFPVFIHPQTREEYALARKEIKSGHGYKGFTFDTRGVSLYDDLYRRDFTINAMAIDENGTLHDPFGGRNDLEQKIIRHISPHFAEDPLRVLRAARFAATLQFEVHASTLELMSEICKQGELEHLTAERVYLELEKTLLNARQPSIFFKVLSRCGALEIVFPEIANLQGIAQNPKYHPEGDAFIHTMQVLDQACYLSNKLNIRLGALLHDVGKAITPKDELPHHILHDERGVNVAQGFCKRLKVPTLCTEFCIKVVKYHMMAHQAKQLKAKTILKLFNGLDLFRNSQLVEDFLVCCRADNLGKLIWSNLNSDLNNSLIKDLNSNEEFLQLLAQNLIQSDISPVVEKYKHLGGKVIGEQIKLFRIMEIKRLKKLLSIREVSEKEV